MQKKFYTKNKRKIECLKKKRKRRKCFSTFYQEEQPQSNDLFRGCTKAEYQINLYPQKKENLHRVMASLSDAYAFLYAAQHAITKELIQHFFLAPKTGKTLCKKLLWQQNMLLNTILFEVLQDEMRIQFREHEKNVQVFAAIC